MARQEKRASGARHESRRARATERPRQARWDPKLGDDWGLFMLATVSAIVEKRGERTLARYRKTITGKEGKVIRDLVDLYYMRNILREYGPEPDLGKRDKKWTLKTPMEEPIRKQFARWNPHFHWYFELGGSSTRRGWALFSDEARELRMRGKPNQPPDGGYAPSWVYPY